MISFSAFEIDWQNIFFSHVVEKKTSETGLKFQTKTLICPFKMASFSAFEIDLQNFFLLM
jgi:hypothetical protein